MAVLKAKARKKLSKTQFALPSQRAYPIFDKAHARNALARAAQQLKAHHLTLAQYHTIVRAAHRKLAAGRKGKI